MVHGKRESDTLKLNPCVDDLEKGNSFFEDPPPVPQFMADAVGVAFPRYIYDVAQ